jgi:hypothetical protein
VGLKTASFNGKQGVVEARIEGEVAVGRVAVLVDGDATAKTFAPEKLVVVSTIPEGKSVPVTTNAPGVMLPPLPARNANAGKGKGKSTKTGKGDSVDVAARVAATQKAHADAIAAEEDPTGTRGLVRRMASSFRSVFGWGRGSAQDEGSSTDA